MKVQPDTQLTEHRLALVVRFRELLAEVDVHPTTLVDGAMGYALERLLAEKSTGPSGGIVRG